MNFAEIVKTASEAPEVANRSRFADSLLGRAAERKNFDGDISKYDAPVQLKNKEIDETPQPIKNKQDGLEREKSVAEELEKKYPAEDGYSIESEVYLRDENGQIVKDPVTGEARRIDFVVVKNGKVVDSIEVTSKTADKTEQTAKENRIRDAGGNFIKDGNGNLIEIPRDVSTRIERRD
jgi:hypothetical protein